MKNLLNRLSKVNRKTKGFTMIELLIVISIIAVLAAIGSVSVYSYIEHSREVVCLVNRNKLLKLFQIELMDETSSGNSDAALKSFLLENSYVDLCPTGGTIDVLNRKLICSIHADEKDEDDGNEEDDGSVPYLYNTIILDG